MAHREGSLSETIEITCKLPATQRVALERLVFFNLNQHRVRAAIEQSIAIYGAPEISEQHGCLRIRVGDIDGVQNLFALSATGRLLGVAVFARLAFERFVVLHLGVEAPGVGDSPFGTRVLLRLMHEVRRAARRTRGV